MLIIPAIDLKNGTCVRLRQGRMADATVYSDDPVATASRWVEAGAESLHVVDLDGAFAGKPENKEAVAGIIAKFPQLPVQLGGRISFAPFLIQMRWVAELTRTHIVLSCWAILGVR